MSVSNLAELIELEKAKAAIVIEAYTSFLVDVLMALKSQFIDFTWGKVWINEQELTSIVPGWEKQLIKRKANSFSLDVSLVVGKLVVESGVTLHVQPDKMEPSVKRRSPKQVIDCSSSFVMGPGRSANIKEVADGIVAVFASAFQSDGAILDVIDNDDERRLPSPREAAEIKAIIDKTKKLFETPSQR